VKAVLPREALIKTLLCSCSSSLIAWLSCLEFHYAAFTLNGFDDQKRNLTFVKTDFRVLKVKFHTSNFN